MTRTCHPTTLTPRCHARTAHMTWSHVQHSFDIAVHMAISHSQRYPEKGTASGRKDRGRATAAESAGKSPRSSRGMGPQSAEHCPQVGPSTHCIQAGHKAMSPIQLGHAWHCIHPLLLHTVHA